MLEQTIKGKIPLIHVTTDDPMHVNYVLDEMAGFAVPAYGDTKKKLPVYFVMDHDYTMNQLLDMYSDADDNDYTIVFINGEITDHMFSCGEILPTKEIINEAISDYFTKKSAKSATEVLAGLSIKAVKLVINLTTVYHSQLTVENLRKTKDFLFLNITGIVPVSLKTDFYFPVDQSIMDWADKNKSYMFSKVDSRLSPKGVLLHGDAGTGKTEFARYVARDWGIPLFLLDVNAMLTKWQGEAEHYLNRALTTLDNESPCVVLFDEVEKLFNDHSENDTSQRLLSKILWWLQYKESKVLVVMTCNDMKVIPPELYRAGRISSVFEMKGIPKAKVKQFVMGLLSSFGIENETIAKKIVATFTHKTFVDYDKKFHTQASIFQRVVNHLQSINFGI